MLGSAVFDPLSVALGVSCICLAVVSYFGATILLKQWFALSGSAVGLQLGMFLAGMVSLVKGAGEVRDFLLFDPTFFFDLILPIIIFEAGLATNRNNFFQKFLAINLTAFLGTVLVMLIIFFAMHGLALAGALRDTLPWTETLKFSALISAIDPVATIAVLRELKVPGTLFSIVFGESIVNDAVALVLFESVEHLSPDDPVSAGHIVWTICWSMVLSCLASLAISIILSLLGAALMNTDFSRRISAAYPTHTASAVILYSFVAYYVSALVGSSGILSVFFCGMLTGHYTFESMGQYAERVLEYAISVFAHLAENFAFLYMGAAIVFRYSVRVPGDEGEDAFSTHLHQVDWSWVATSVAVVFISRAFNTYPLLWISSLRDKRSRLRKEKRRLGVESTEEVEDSTGDGSIPLSYQHVIFFAGLRGAIAFAISSKLEAEEGPMRETLFAATVANVLFSNIVIGGLTPTLIRLVGVPMGATDENRSSSMVLSKLEKKMDTPPMEEGESSTTTAATERTQNLESRSSKAGNALEKGYENATPQPRSYSALESSLGLPTANDTGHQPGCNAPINQPDVSTLPTPRTPPFTLGAAYSSYHSGGGISSARNLLSGRSAATGASCSSAKHGEPVAGLSSDWSHGGGDRVISFSFLREEGEQQQHLFTEPLWWHQFDDKYMKRFFGGRKRVYTHDKASQRRSMKPSLQAENSETDVNVDLAGDVYHSVSSHGNRWSAVLSSCSSSTHTAGLDTSREESGSAIRYA